MKYYCHDGEFLPEVHDHFTQLNRGLLYGEGVFENIKVEEGKILFMEQHLQRLQAGCAVLGLSSINSDILRANLLKMVATNDIFEGTLRLMVAGGQNKGILPNITSTSVYYITSKRGRPYPPDVYARGFRCFVSSIRRNPFSPVTYLKSLNYLENILARKEAAEEDCDEAIFLNTAGYLTEGSISNLFLVVGEKILTPEIPCGLLEGITRTAIIDICAANKFPLEEGKYTIDKLLTADEAFLTNSVMGVMPLAMVAGRAVSHGEPGRMTARISHLYRKFFKTV